MRAIVGSRQCERVAIVGSGQRYKTIKDGFQPCATISLPEGGHGFCSIEGKGNLGRARNGTPQKF